MKHTLDRLLLASLLAVVWVNSPVRTQVYTQAGYDQQLDQARQMHQVPLSITQRSVNDVMSAQNSALANNGDNSEHSQDMTRIPSLSSQYQQQAPIQQPQNQAQVQPQMVSETRVQAQNQVLRQVQQHQNMQQTEQQLQSQTQRSPPPQQPQLSQPQSPQPQQSQQLQQVHQPQQISLVQQNQPQTAQQNQQTTPQLSPSILSTTLQPQQSTLQSQLVPQVPSQSQYHQQAQVAAQSPTVQYHMAQQSVIPTQHPEQSNHLTNYPTQNYHHPFNYPLYIGHNPFIEILRPNSYADDNIMTLNLSHSHIYEIDTDAFVGQRFEHIDLSYNKLGRIHSRSFRIGPKHSKHSPYNSHSNVSKTASTIYPTRRPPPTHPKSVTIDFSHNPAILALPGAFDHIDVPNCLLNFTNATVELKFGAFKKYLKDHPGHIIDIESVDCCEQEWLLGYKHNFVARTHCDHDPTLFLTKVPQQTIIDSCIAYITSARHSMTIQGPSTIYQVAATPRHPNTNSDCQDLTNMILGGTAMILTSLSIYIIFYMFSLKAVFESQLLNKS